MSNILVDTLKALEGGKINHERKCSYSQHKVEKYCDCGAFKHNEALSKAIKALEEYIEIDHG